MLIRCKILGNGTAGNPYRAPFPTYQLMEHDPLNGVGVVSVPDADIPVDVVRAGALAGPVHINQPAAQPMPPAVLDAIYAHLDKRYAEHKGEFRPELA